MGFKDRISVPDCTVKSENNAAGRNSTAWCKRPNVLIVHVMHVSFYNLKF